MSSGTIKLLDKAGEIVKQARYNNNTDKRKFIETCKKLYAARILKQCKFKSVADVQLAKNVKAKERGGATTIKQKSNFKKNKFGVPGGTTGKYIRPVRASRYY